jgi:hypothetical protein
MDASPWIDESGNLWLFGGTTQDAATHKFDALNDPTDPTSKNDHNHSNIECALTQIDTYEKSRLDIG